MVCPLGDAVELAPPHAPIAVADGRHDATVRHHDVRAGQPVELVTGRGVGALGATARGAIEVDNDATVPVVDLATERQNPLDVLGRNTALLHAGAGMGGKCRWQRWVHVRLA